MIPAVGTRVGAVVGGVLLGADGHFRANPGVRLPREHEIQGRARDDRVASPDPAAATVTIDAAGLWVTPGFVDAHTHLAWSDFDAADRTTDPDQQASAAARNQLATLRAGVTAARDAGGYGSDLFRRLAGSRRPRLKLSLEILGAEDAQGERHLRDRVTALADAGAQWVKVAATGGVGAGSAPQEPVFTAGEFRAIASAADRHGLPVMVHAWGGPAIDQAITLGVRSIEHAVHLTAGQAAAAASAGVFVVPTVWIYTDVLHLAEAGRLPRTLAPAARRAVDAHPVALRHCLDAGVPLAMGTDAGLACQHGANLHELAAMVEAGVPAADALRAATTGGATLLGLSEAERAADLVLFDRDPSVPSVARDQRAVVAVVKAGRVVHAR